LPSIKVDDQALSEVVYTLVDNAAKYSPSGSPIRIAATPGEPGKIMISVADRGPGIQANVRDRVFEKFFRAMRDGDVGDRKSSGTGMGLAIARGIVEAHGGRIWIEAVSTGTGSIFMIEVPIGDGDPAILSVEAAKNT
jgi:two-component system sensor histidine kinase KdpD